MLTCPTCRGLTPNGTSTTCLHCDRVLPRPPKWVLRLTSLLGPAGAILLAACYGGPMGRYRVAAPQPTADGTPADHDGDGSYAWTCTATGKPGCKPPDAPPADCDDNDPTRFPGAADVDGDGIDQNCDGVDGVREPNTVAAPADAGL